MGRRTGRERAHDAAEGDVGVPSGDAEQRRRRLHADRRPDLRGPRREGHRRDSRRPRTRPRGNEVRGLNVVGERPLLFRVAPVPTLSETRRFAITVRPLKRDAIAVERLGQIRKTLEKIAALLEGEEGCNLGAEFVD